MSCIASRRKRVFVVSSRGHKDNFMKLSWLEFASYQSSFELDLDKTFKIHKCIIKNFALNYKYYYVSMLSIV